MVFRDSGVAVRWFALSVFSDLSRFFFSFFFFGFRILSFEAHFPRPSSFEKLWNNDKCRKSECRIAPDYLDFHHRVSSSLWFIPPEIRRHSFLQSESIWYSVWYFPFLSLLNASNLLRNTTTFIGFLGSSNSFLIPFVEYKNEICFWDDISHLKTLFFRFECSDWW